MASCTTVIQGTTPTHTFALPPDLEAIKRARYVYSQRGEVVIIKDSNETESPVRLEEGKTIATLSQEETFKFEPNVVIELVLRVLTEGGKALATDAVLLICRENKDKEVLV